jgi:hypothetical protein
MTRLVGGFILPSACGAGRFSPRSTLQFANLIVSGLPHNGSQSDWHAPGMRSSRQLVNEVETALNQNGLAALVVRFKTGDEYLFTEGEELPVARLEDMRATGGKPIAIAVARKGAAGGVKIQARCLVETVADRELQKQLPGIAHQFRNHLQERGLA